MTVAVEFDHVSKRFPLQIQREQSLQEAFINFITRRNRVEKPDQDGFWVLKDVSFAIERGETVGFIGVNGAGKSTILKLISQILYPTSGEITIHGRVGALLELGTGFHPDMTGRENIYLNGSMLGLSRRDIDRRLSRIIDFSELDKFIDVQVKHYSSGMYVRLGFAVAVHMRPDVLLVDEVLAVGDAAFQRKCMDQINFMRRNGTTILFVSHSHESVQAICDRAIWLEDGEVIEDGTAEDVVMKYMLTTYEDNAVVNMIDDLPEDHDDDETNEDATPPQRWGTSAITIEAVRLLGADGEERDFFVAGDPLIIELDYIATERVEKPVFGVGLHRDDDTHIAGPNTKFARLDIAAVEGKGTVRYTIESLPILDGTYFVSVAATDFDTTTMFDYHDRLYPFRVYAGSGEERYGLVALRGQWQLLPSATPTSVGVKNGQP